MKLSIASRTREKVVAAIPGDTELALLRSFKKQSCITIYQPSIATNSSGGNPNRIELKNRLREAESLMTKQHIAPNAIDATIKPAYLLLASNGFWTLRHATIALFMHSSFFRHYELPRDDIPASIRLGRGFDVQPLAELLEGRDKYFVLMLSHKNVRLYEGNQSGLKQLHLNQLGGSMTQTLNIDEYPKARELHPVASAAIYGKGSEGYHQQYDVSQTDKDMLLAYFRRVDGYLHHFLNERKAPLLLAGVGYLLPIYRQANTYSNLLEQEVTGNLERETLKSMHDKVLQALPGNRP